MCVLLSPVLLIVLTSVTTPSKKAPWQLSCSSERPVHTGWLLLPLQQVLVLFSLIDWHGQQSSKIKSSWSCYILLILCWLLWYRGKNNLKLRLRSLGGIISLRNGPQCNFLCTPCLWLAAVAGLSLFPHLPPALFINWESRLLFFWRNQFCVSWASGCMCRFLLGWLKLL